MTVGKIENGEVSAASTTCDLDSLPEGCQLVEYQRDSLRDVIQKIARKAVHHEILLPERKFRRSQLELLRRQRLLLLLWCIPFWLERLYKFPELNR
jgi:hypothetical protein